MKRLIRLIDPRSWLFFGFLVTLTSCLPTVEMEQVVYSNDFSDLNLASFENGRLFIFQGDTVAGYYHNEEVAVTLTNLPLHNFLRVTIDVLIHDSWDGNSDDGVAGPDFWYMGIDDNEIFRTTFSNLPCASTFCLRQSYPNDYFRQNDPKSGAVRTNLRGRCIFGGFQNYTTRYSISKIFTHTNWGARIFTGAELLSINSANPACDESWSIAKIEIEAIKAD